MRTLFNKCKIAPATPQEKSEALKKIEELSDEQKACLSMVFDLEPEQLQPAHVASFEEWALGNQAVAQGLWRKEMVDLVTLGNLAYNLRYAGVCDPSYEEQQIISTYLDQEVSRIDIIVNKIREEIDLIQEYRTRFISDVVTGKVDVRSMEISDENPADHTMDGISSPEGSKKF